MLFMEWCETLKSGNQEVSLETSFNAGHEQGRADGLAEGKRLAFEAACKAQCDLCAVGQSVGRSADNQLVHKTNEVGFTGKCLAFRIRRAAEQMSVKLEEKKYEAQKDLPL